MRKLLFAALCCLLSSAAWAGSSTVNYTSSGASPFRTTTDGSSNNLGQQTIWDSSAGANGWTIDSTHSGWVGGPIANGSAPTQNPIWFAGWDGTNLRAISTDSTGKLNVNNISGTISLPTGAATSANQATEISSLATIATNTGAAVPAGTNLIGNVGTIIPAGATAITASATGTTAATTATLAGTSGKTTYMCWMSIRANATAAATGNATVTGTITGTLNFTQWTAPLASGIGIVEEIFNPCVPASGTNTGIAIISAAPGSGGTVSVSGGGYQM